MRNRRRYLVSGERRREARAAGCARSVFFQREAKQVNYSEKNDLRVAIRRKPGGERSSITPLSPKGGVEAKQKDRGKYGSFPSIWLPTFVTRGNQSVIDRPRMPLLRLRHHFPLVRWLPEIPPLVSVVGIKMVDLLDVSRTSWEEKKKLTAF